MQPSLLIPVSMPCITKQHLTVWCPLTVGRESLDVHRTQPPSSGNSKFRTQAHASKHSKVRHKSKVLALLQGECSLVSALFHLGKWEAEMLVRYSGKLMRKDKTGGICFARFPGSNCWCKVTTAPQRERKGAPCQPRDRICLPGRVEMDSLGKLNQPTSANLQQYMQLKCHF